MYNVEDVFVTEGVPEYTFVRPPNFGEILVDVRRLGKPVIIEGQSGTGKTTCIRRILEEINGERVITFWTPRRADELPKIKNLSISPSNGTYVIDDFHRLDDYTKEQLADIAKLTAEDPDRKDLPKLIIIGINQVGSDLIQLVPDIAKRMGVHRIHPGTEKNILQIIRSGCEKLNVSIENEAEIVTEVRGDYWLAQQVCRTLCGVNEIFSTSSEAKIIRFESAVVRQQVVDRLKSFYSNAVKEFCRGRRFRPTNDPYFKLLRLVGQQDQSNVDLNMLANAHPDVRGSINNVKDRRLAVLLAEKPICGRHFYYDSETKNFAIEDPALFYYIRHLDWDNLRRECGFRDGVREFEYDVAISFAGENRALAEEIFRQLEALDVRVFYDRIYESNFLGGTWTKAFSEIFKEKSRLIVAILDENHSRKIWPTFERDVFAERVSDEAVIPILLDDTVFVGFPRDLNAIFFKDKKDEYSENDVTDRIVSPLVDKLDSFTE